MRRILILGVNGFIGHHLSQRIVADTDWEIYGMDMQSDRVADLLTEKRFHFFELDFEANLPIVRACVRHRKRIVFPSTSEVYGMCGDDEFDPERSDLVLGP